MQTDNRNLDILHQLGYSIDDGRILKEKPNSVPLPLGEYQGNLAPKVEYDFTSFSQTLSATALAFRLLANGINPELSVKSSRGKLTQEIKSWNRELAELRDLNRSFLDVLTR